MNEFFPEFTFFGLISNR